MIWIEEHGSVHVLRISRADKANALTEQLKREIAAAVEERSRDTRTRAIVVTGDGPYFCSGSDVVEMSHFSPQEMQRMLTTESRLYRSLLQSPKPVVSAVNGFALGGGVALAACSDWVVASEEARFGMPELGVGVAISLEGALLPWIVGLGHARRLAYDPSTRMDAAEAFQVGLVQERVSASDLESAALERAGALARLPAGAFALQKRLILTLLLTGAGEAVVEVSRHGTPLLFAGPETRRALEQFQQVARGSKSELNRSMPGRGDGGGS